MKKKGFQCLTLCILFQFSCYFILLDFSFSLYTKKKQHLTFYLLHARKNAMFSIFFFVIFKNILHTYIILIVQRKVNKHTSKEKKINIKEYFIKKINKIFL